MPYTDETVDNLIINVLTNSQYDSITTPSDTELYLITDDPDPVADVKVNGTSVVNNGEANLVTNTAYNASSNKIATMADISGGTVTSVGITNGGGLSVSGSPITSSGSITIGHSNSVTAQTTQAVYPIKIDANGHISAYGSAVTIPTVTSSYSSTGTNAVNGTAVNAALQTLDSSISATSGQAISAVTITDGKISSSSKISVGNVSHDDSASAASAVPINADQLQGYTVSSLTSALKTEIKSEIKAEIISTLFPINSIYITYTNTNPSSTLGGTWELISSVGLASNHVFGNDYSITLTGSTDSAGAKRVLYSYQGYAALDKNTYGQTKGTSVSSAGTSALSSYTALGVVSKDQAGNNPEYSGLVADTITLYTWKRTA